MSWGDARIGNICLTRWECDGQLTFGDYEEFLWPEYVRQFHP